MKLKNWTILIVTLLVGALFLSACGSDTQQQVEEAAGQVAETAAVVVDAAATTAAEVAMHAEETAVAMAAEAEAAAEEAASTAEPAAEPTAEETMPEVFLTIWADDTRAPILQGLAEEFEATYGVGLVIEQVGFGDIRDQMVIAAPAGEGPDLFIGAHDWLGQLVSSGLLAPIDLGDKADLFTEVGITGCTYEGQLYCMPYAQENLAFFYNTDLVSEPPATWDEVVEIGTALQESGNATYGFALTGTTYDAFPLDTAFGGYIFGRDDAGNYNPQDLGVDSEGMIAAGQWMADQVASGFMPNTTDWDTTHTLFEQGEIPFMMAGPWALERIRNSGVPYAITTFPEGPAGAGQPFAGVQGFFVNALGENALLAQAFLSEFVATDGVMQALFDAGQRPSAFVPVLEAIEDADIVAFGEAGADAVLMPAIPEMGSVWGSWGDAVTLILNGEQTADEALTTGAAQIRDLVAGAAAGMVNVPGSWQAAAGIDCGDWDPACEGSALTEGADGMFTGTFTLPAGDYETKVALDGSWTTNYGVDGKQDGDNYQFSLAADGSVTFTYDPDTHILTIETK